MKLALGTVQFGLDYGVASKSGRVTVQEAGAILRGAQIRGINTIDTAIAYGDSEVVLGQLGVKNWNTITKLPAVPNDCRDVKQWVYDQTQESLSRLSISQLYGVLLHRPAQLFAPMGEDLYVGLQDLKEKGITHKVGISVYSTNELSKLLNYYSFDLVQAPLNILDRRLIESGWASRLSKAGIEVHSRSTFLQGLLLMPSYQRPAKFNLWADTLKEWDQWLERSGLTSLQACMRYVSNLKEVDCVVVGVDTLDQLSQIVDAAEGELKTLPEFKALKDTRLIDPSCWNQL